MPKLENPQIPAERDHIDRKQHAKRMNSGRRPDKQPASGVKPPPARQTYQAGERRIGYCDPCADRGGPRYVSEVHCVVFTSDGVEGQSRSIKLYLRVLSAIYHECKHGHRQNACHDPNDCCRIHWMFPPFFPSPVNFSKLLLATISVMFAQDICEPSPYLNDCMFLAMFSTAGASNTIKMHGNMNSTRGKSILTFVFAAISSARCRLF